MTEHLLGELPEPSGFICPKCFRISYNPRDAVERFCSACKEFFPTQRLKSVDSGFALIDREVARKLEKQNPLKYVIWQKLRPNCLEVYDRSVTTALIPLLQKLPREFHKALMDKMVSVSVTIPPATIDLIFKAIDGTYVIANPINN